MKTQSEPMLMKVGDLAKRTGLTVRTLHHYDEIGLLTPSARSDSGYRLYDRSDIERLHQIQAMRRFGVALADIGTFLANPDADLTLVVEQQLGALARQIAQANSLHQQLTRLHQQLKRGETPELASWLSTLELMTMYDKYFSKEELSQMPLYRDADKRNGEWPALVAQVRALVDAGTPPFDPRAQQLARQWMMMVVRDTDGNPAYFARIDAMHTREPSVQESTGITPAIKDYILQAEAERKLAIYANYLNEAELDFMRANMVKQSDQWPPLIAEVAKAVAEEMDPASPAAKRLAYRWHALFQSYAGADPATHARFAMAHQQEPELSVGSFVTPQIIGFLRQVGMAKAR